MKHKHSQKTQFFYVARFTTTGYSWLLCCYTNIILCQKLHASINTIHFCIMITKIPCIVWFYFIVINIIYAAMLTTDSLYLYEKPQREPYLWKFWLLNDSYYGGQERCMQSFGGVA